ncbi:MAG: hypothetical protein ABS81_11005 [Pseudonocardia sp. SCN 72-86]|nr:MAG: hypothetical protein ABS81_11005 [Pseudonocardia sp. SCN 72-86]
MRSILEVPILVDRFWGKVPELGADAILVDLEDSTQAQDKVRARERVVEFLAAPEHVGGRQIIVRTNNLATEWGRADLAAVAGADVLVCYPKVRTADEMAEVAALVPGQDLYVMIETARAMIEIDRIAAVIGVAGLHFGYVDYAADVGARAFSDTGGDLFAPANHYARTKVAVVAAAYGLFCSGGTLVPNYRDLGTVRSFIRQWADLGYTACIAVAPSHLGIINEVLAPGPDEVRAAEVVCAAYEEAMSRGEPSAIVDGKIVTMPDYRLASVVLARASV